MDNKEFAKKLEYRTRQFGISIIKLSSVLPNSIEGNVSEMFKGKTYVLFRYRIIKDVRIVYAPPRSIGEFGGETDNWVWPRHTGDFARELAEETLLAIAGGCFY